MELLFDDRDEHVDRDGDPDLGLDGVLGSAEETLDTEMLLEPFEKQFDLPTALVESANGQRRELKVVGQEHESRCRFGSLETDPTELLRIALTGADAVEHDRLIADKACGPIGGCRVDAPRIRVLFGSGDEECARLSERKEPLEIQIRAVHDIERARLGDQKVENVDVVDIPLGDVDEARDRAMQIQQSVKL